MSMLLLWKFLKGLLNNRLVQIAIVLGVLGLLGYKAYAMYQHEKQQRVLAELQLQTQIEIVKDAQARIAHTEFVSDSMLHLVDAAHKLNGTVVAALKLAIAERQVVFVHDTLPTETDTLGTRTAHVRDSTALGILDATITAPLPPANLGLRYTFTQPAFAPEIGFVQVGDSMVAVVYWQDTKVEVKAPYWKPQPKRLGTFGGMAELNYWFTDHLVEARVGGVLRVGEWRAQLFGTTTFTSTDVGLGAGIRREF